MVDEIKISEKAVWSLCIYVDCPYCGCTQDLMDDDGFEVGGLEVGEHGTERTTNTEVWCIDCDKQFIVPDLEW